MKKFFILIFSMMILIGITAGCGLASADNTQPTEDVSQPTSGDTGAPASETAQTGNVPVAGTPAESYTGFLNAKSAVLSKLDDALSHNGATQLTYITLLDLKTADLWMLPASYFGAGQEAAAAGLSTLNASDVIYSENANSYSITYTDEQDATYIFSGTYDAAADALVCTAQKDEKVSFSCEYRRTPYGYASQYFFINDDDTTSLYQFAISGADGTIGVSTTQTTQPAALTGSEAADFPTALPEWYSITGSAVTGKMADDTEINFEYVPTPSE